MTPETLMWILSATGAALFFAAGRLYPRPQAATAGAVPEDTLGERPSDRTSVRDDAVLLTAALDRASRDAEVAIQARTAAEQEVARLRAENQSLKERLADDAGPIESALPAAALAGGRTGELLQSLVERVSSIGNVRTAVVADDLGLVVASHGEHGDELAAIGALFTRAGAHARRVLPMRTIGRVTLEDDHDVVVTLHPFSAGEEGDGIGDLSLITLAVGTAPDRGQVARLLNEAPTTH